MPEEKRKFIRDSLKGFVFVGQLGLNIVTPVVVMLAAAYFASHYLGWGGWVVPVSLVIGLLTAFSTAKGFFAKETEKNKKQEAENPVPRGYSDHM